MAPTITSHAPTIFHAAPIKLITSKYVYIHENLPYRRFTDHRLPQKRKKRKRVKLYYDVSGARAC